MGKFLKIALIGTGAAAALAVLSPSLVTVGVFLILPGLILVVAPTLFLYLAIFSAMWFGLRAQGWLLASVCGVAAIGFVGVGLPTVMNRETDARHQEATRSEKTPASPVGHMNAAVIAIEYPAKRQVAARCDELCQLLLYNDEARVVVTRTASHRISPDDCTIRPEEIKQTLQTSFENWGNTESVKTVAQAVRLRIAAEDCLHSTVAVPANRDLTVAWVDDTIGSKAGPWSLAPGEASMQGVEIRKGDAVVAREVVTRSSRLSIPLYFEPYGSGIAFTGWRWHREWTPRSQPAIDRLAMLKRMTAFDLDTPRGGDAGTIRKVLDAALKDPSGSGAAFAVVGDYYALLHKEGLEAGDTERLARLIEDARMTDFTYVFELPKRDGRIASRLREALLKRLAKAVKAEDREPARNVAYAASRLPKGAFADASPDFDGLVSDRALRTQMRVLIPRLAEKGARGVDTLISILEDSFIGSRSSISHDMEAVVTGLCSAGEATRGSLPRLMRIHEKYEKDIATRGTAWRSLLVALGADPSMFRSVVVKDQARYEEELRRGAKRCAASYKI